MESIVNKRRKEVSQRILSSVASSPSDEYVSQDELMYLLYQIDEFGLPDLGLGLVFSGKARPEVQQYAKSSLLHHVVGSGSYDTADDALFFVPEHEFQYGREREIYSNKVLNELKNLKESKNVPK